MVVETFIHNVKFKVFISENTMDVLGLSNV